MKMLKIKTNLLISLLFLGKIKEKLNLNFEIKEANNFNPEDSITTDNLIIEISYLDAQKLIRYMETTPIKEVFPKRSETFLEGTLYQQLYFQLTQKLFDFEEDDKSNKSNIRTMKTAEITLKFKADFKDENDLLFLEDLKKEIGNTLYLYGKEYQGNLRLADQNPNKSVLWNDKLYMPDVVPVVIEEINEQ